MPTFTFKSPEGKTYDIEAPEGTTKEQAFRVLQDQIAPTRAPAADRPLEDPLASVAGVPQRGESQAQLRTGTLAAVKSWFQPRDPSEVSMGEAGGAIAGGGATGAVGGAVLPRAMQVGGRALAKVPFGPAKAVGAGAQALGAAMELIPTGERVARGAAGGAAMAGTEKAGEAMGLSQAATTALGFGAGAAADTATGFAMRETGKLVRFAASLGDPRSLSQAPKRALSEESAKALQKQLFGEKTEGYVEGLIGSDHRMATQEALRRADPSLAGAPPQVLARTPEARPVPGTGFAVPGEGDLVLHSRSDVPVALKAAAPRDGFGDAKAAAMAKTQRQREASAANTAKLASDIYRERMFGGVAKALRNGHLFSEGPEFNAFVGKLQTQVALGEIPQSQANKLLRGLAADRSGNPEVLNGYAESFDNRIREWGKPGEVGGQTGAAAVPAKAAAKVRADLREAANAYMKRIGLGEVEQKYRSAYMAEKLAEAKDKLPHFLYGFGKAEQFSKMARDLARDPESKAWVQKSLMQHLAQQEPQNVMGQFNKLQKVLVDAELVTPAHLRDLRVAAEQVQRTVDKGAQLRAADRFKRLVMMTAVEKAGAEGGARGGAAAGGME